MSESESGEVWPELTKKELRSFGLSRRNYEKLQQFYDKNYKKLLKKKEPIHIRKEKYGLPRSLVYIPKGAQKGMYVLCKDKGRIEVLGYGGFNAVSIALSLDTGEKKAFRSARSRHVEEEEIKANKKIVDYPGFFATGTPVEYRGSWSDRRGHRVGDRKFNPKEFRVRKTGIMMDCVEGGELSDHLGTLSRKQKLEISIEYALMFTQCRLS